MSEETVPTGTSTPDPVSDEEFMRHALALADAAALRGEVPVGCLIVSSSGEVLGRGANQREAEQDPTAHAEILALRSAARTAGSWRLDDATMYVTLEPCAMCAGALVLARVRRVVYGCDDPKAGAVVSLYEIGQDARLNHRFVVTRGVLGKECADRLSRFFATLRAQGKK